MAVVEMQKVAIITHESAKEQLIESLHKEGVMEITQSDSPVVIDHTEVNFRSAELQFTIITLKDYASKETLAVAGKYSNERDIIHASKHTDVRGIVDRLHELEEEDTDAEKQIKQSQQIAEVLDPWRALPYSLDVPNASETTIRIEGSIPKVKLSEMIKELGKLKLELSEVNNKTGIIYCVAHVWKDDAPRFEELAIKYGWTNVDLPKLEGKAAELHEQALMHAKEMTKVRYKNAKERTRLSVELPNLIKVAKFMMWLNEKQEAREAMSSTEETSTILGWVPKKRVEKLEQRLQDVELFHQKNSNLSKTSDSPNAKPRTSRSDSARVGPAVALLKVKPNEDEEVPVALWNSKGVTPFESVTTLYGLPLQHEFDPTVSLMPFFALYFALCLTDAGYGAVLATVFGIAILKKKLKMRESKLAWTLFLGGVVTIIVSIPFGGYFGFAPSQVPAFLTKTNADGMLLFKGQIWNLNDQSGITFLQNLSLFLGLTHLFYGMFLAGLHKWIHGKKMEAFWMNFTPHILLGAILFMVFAPISLKPVAKYIFYASLLMLVWGKGHGAKLFLRPLMGAIGVLNFAIGMLSNTLSYLRILALGLVTGAIAMAVNQVAVEVGKLFPIFIAVPVIILIFCMGHLISIALNTLGSFIHSGRLQFIEFFSQFFEGGGKAFSPFKRSSI